MSTIAGLNKLDVIGTAQANASVTVIDVKQGLARISIRELWRYRGLAWMLAWRDFQIRYKQSLLGITWVVLQPLAMVGVISLVLGHLLGLSKQVEGSYAVFVCCGIIPWTLFAASVSSAANSLVNNAPLLQKVYVPRLLVTLSALGAPLADFIVALLVMFGFMIATGTAFSLPLLLLPAMIGSILLAAAGVSILLSALTVWYRDFRLITPFLLQIWFFSTPVIYPLPVAEKWNSVLSINPMYGPISAIRAAVQAQPIDYGSWAISTGVALFLTIIGIKLFTQMERRFADVV